MLYTYHIYVYYSEANRHAFTDTHRNVQRDVNIRHASRRLIEVILHLVIHRSHASEIGATLHRYL